MNRIQDADIKGESELVTLGANKSYLPNDNKIYLKSLKTILGIDKTLEEAITEKLIPAFEWDAILGLTHETWADLLLDIQDGWRVFVAINESNTGIVINNNNIEVVFKKGITITSNVVGSNTGIIINGNYVSIINARLKDFLLGVQVNNGELWAEIKARFNNCSSNYLDNGTNTSLKEIQE